jgi:hypothetical protein
VKEDTLQLFILFKLYVFGPPSILCIYSLLSFNFGKRGFAVRLFPAVTQGTSNGVMP